MPSPLICGSFQNHEDGDVEFLASCTCASPKSKKPTKRHSFGGTPCKGNKNPYADRGLDKFSALVAELDSKRQKIYTQKGSQDISLLGFAYSKPDDYKPIVVRLNKNKKEQTISSQKDKHTSDYNISSPESSEIEAAKPDQVKVLSRIVSNIKMSPKKVSFKMLQNIKVDNLRQPVYYLSLIIILILAFLTVFGRSFTILCTTLCWYFIPAIQSLDVKKTNKRVKKDYVKALSYNKIITSNDYEISDMKKAKTMKKAVSFNNKFVKISSNLDHGLSSPKSVFGCKLPPQPVSQP